MAEDIWSEEVARVYDATLREMGEPEAIQPAVEFLRGLADKGRALEFAIGTGRIGLPLSAAGTEVHGIELSPAMIEQLAAKDGADRVTVTNGDMATTHVDGKFDLVYLVYNTITNLLTQAEQVECFRNAAAHLVPGGHFVIEVGLPNLRRLPPGERFAVFDVSDGHIGVEEYDFVNQLSVSHHVWTGDGAQRLFHSPHRYAWPAEYDLMAQLAGMELTERWANWHRDEFTGESESHVSVWCKP